MKPLVLINFKNYKEAIGANAINLSKKLAQVKKRKYDLAVAPSLLQMKDVCNKTNLKVFAQHVDSEKVGSFTGHINAKEVKQIGAAGTILNHSERKLSFNDLKKTIECCKKNRLVTIVCASTISEIKKVAQLKPDYIAYEPKELIGGNLSVTKANPDIIVKAVEAVKKSSPQTSVLCGAGIHSREDIGNALLLGTDGVLIGHSVPKAKDPQNFLDRMLL